MKSLAGRPSTKALVAGFFGLAVLTSGFWRFFSAEGGHAGLWFGIVMGGLALAGGWQFRRQRILMANLLTWLSILFVGGWFSYESFVKKGFADAEARQLIVISLTVIVAISLVLLSRRKKVADASHKPDSGDGQAGQKITRSGKE